MHLRHFHWFKPFAWIILTRLIRLRFPDVKSLSTNELSAWLAKKGISEPLLLDVRTSEEYQVSHLRNAQLAPAHIEEVIASTTPETPIVAYCSVGYRSAKYAQALQQAGYKQVFNLEGSIFKWANEGRSIYRFNQPTQTVHPYNETWGWFLQLPSGWK